MNQFWQNAAVLLIVAVAVSYLLRQLRNTLTLRKANACGGCGTCSAKSTTGSPQLFELSPPHPSDANRN